MAKQTSQYPITSFQNSWEVNPKDKKPQSGKQIREFLFQQGNLKVGALRFDQRSQLLYGFATEQDAADWEQSGSISKVLTKTLVSMTQKAIDITTNLPSTNLNYSTVVASIPFTATFLSKKKEYNEENWTTVQEDVYVTIQVAHGENGSWETVVDSSLVAYGGTYTDDFKKYMATGVNKVVITAVGMQSGISNAVRYTLNMTTMFLDASQFSWHKAWKDGENIVIDNLRYYAAASKTIYVKVDNLTPVTFTRTAAQNAETAVESLDITQYVANLTTGNHVVKVWMEALEMTSTVYQYNVMYVKEEDLPTAKLIVVNEVSAQAVNYDTSALFKYASYGTTKATFGVKANDANKEYTIAAEQELTFIAEQQNTYSIRIEVEQEEKITLSLTAKVILNGVTQTITMPVDNSRSFAATSGATFFFNPATRSNGEANRTTIKNESKVSGATATYSATYSGFAWKQKDGYVADDTNRKCFIVQAGSTVAIPNFKPLEDSETQSMSIEMLVKSGTVADYSAPVFYMMSNDTYDASTSVGIVVFPTQIIVLSTTEKNTIAQSVSLTEDEINHLVVVLQRNYNNKGYNLCHIYVNGVRNAVFTYSGTGNFGEGCLKMGQSATDLYVYNMRVYPFVLEHQAIWSNFLNGADSDQRNTLQSMSEIVDGGAISYDLCKQKGYNTILFEGETIPDFWHTSTYTMNWYIKYGNHPLWDVDIMGLPTDGQGTTSMKYGRWNLRGKSDANTVWHFPNNPDIADITGKNGYLFGASSPKVNKITAKKNIASSCQGHKMGGCGFYDALYTYLGFKSNCPNSSVRVAVEQYPFLGFQKYPSGEVVFVGLYTMGADKGNNATFGYSADYPSCLSLEGPNHSPLGTRFMHPWVDAVYDATKKEETLKFGGEEAWDADYPGSHLDTTTGKYVENKTDNSGDAASILSLYESEWKPAYEFVYNTSLYIRSLAQVGKTKTQLLALKDTALQTFRNASTDGIPNSYLQILDTDTYKLYYYRNSTKRYAELEGFNILTNLAYYLGSNTTPTIDEIIAARKQMFAANLGNFFHVDSVVFHDCWQELTGTSDNDAKNFYPFKFKPLTEGGRWSFRQDDVDTSLPFDNNGNTTKSYSIEKGDRTTNGTEIFQGDSSALFYSVRNILQSEKKSMMSRIVNAMLGMAQDYNIVGNYSHETLFNVFSYFYWKNSSKYFPAIAYNKDSDWSYVDVWAKDPTALYNDVAPLTQALGDQLKAEQQWVKRRIAYICSKYNLCGFGGSEADGYGTMEFTPANAFTFHVVPAIDLYPCGNQGGGTNVNAGRTSAGQTADILATSDGSTTFYVKGMDWLTSVGDLSTLRLNTRGGSSESKISFSVASKRLKALKVGDTDTANVSTSGFNASTLNVKGESMESVDASNVASVEGEVSLLGCPRLKTAKFGGTTINSLLLPISAKVGTVVYPSTLKTLFLHSLPLLEASGITMPEGVKKNLTGLYLNSNDKIDGFDMLNEITSISGHALKYVYVVWEGEKSCSSSQFSHLQDFAQGNYNRLNFDPETGQLSNSTDGAYVQGTIRINFYVYDDEVAKITSHLPNVEVLNDKDILHEIPYTDNAVKALLQSYDDALVTGRFSTKEAMEVTSLDDFETSAPLTIPRGDAVTE